MLAGLVASTLKSPWVQPRARPQAKATSHNRRPIPCRREDFLVRRQRKHPPATAGGNDGAGLHGVGDAASEFPPGDVHRVGVVIGDADILLVLVPAQGILIDISKTKSEQAATCYAAEIHQKYIIRVYFTGTFSGSVMDHMNQRF